MAIFMLSSGQKCLVSEEDIDWVSQWKWDKNTNGYARRSVRRNGRITSVLMHRELLLHQGVDVKGVQVDHIDGNKLNNQRDNLRVASNSENSQNRSKTHGKSCYKGVYWIESRKKWKAHIGIGGRQKTIGYFDTEEEAGRAYNKCAESLYTSFAKLNDLKAPT